MRIYFGNYAYLILFGQLLNAGGTRYRVTKWGKCIDTNDSLKLTDISIAECVDACIRREACMSLGYCRRFNFCEIHRSDTLILKEYNGPCIFVKRNDMEAADASICSCSNAGHVCNPISGLCEVKECGHLELLNGTIYGNRHYIGAKLKVSCDQGFTERSGIEQVTCNSTGDWDPTPSCEAVVPTVTTNVTVTAKNIITKEYYCSAYTNGPDYTMFDLHSDGIRIDKRTNIIFQTKGAHDAHILLQHNRNVTSSSVIEIVLGAGGNTWSIMRDAPTTGTTLDQITGAILDPNVYQSFWISWSGKCVQVGKGSIVGKSEIMQWCSLTFIISGMRIGYGWGSDGYFEFVI